MKSLQIKSIILATAGICILMTAITNCTSKTAKEPAISAANLDTTVNPGNDFYRYANGNWLKNNPIPAAYSRYGAFEDLGEENYKQMETLLKEAADAKNAKEGSITQKVRDFYSLGMDTVKIEKDGITPIQADLQHIESIGTNEELQKLIAEMHVTGSAPLFNFYAGQDEQNSSMVIANLYQGGLSLPDRDYYVSDDARSKEIRVEYLKHVGRMLELAGEPKEKAAKDAVVVMQIETSLAKASSTRLELRNPVANYHKVNLEGLQKMAPQFNWVSYFKNIGIDQTEDINACQPKFLAEMAKMVKEVPLEQWKVYLRWNVVDNAASFLSSAFEKEKFAFNGTFLSGVKEQKPRWKRMIDQTSRSLGEIVGQLYVEKYFPPQAKQRMVELVGNLKSALHDRILGLKWMGDSSKKEAIAKLEKINVKVGYPDKWIDYSSLNIGKDSYYENVKKADLFSVKRELNKIGKPVDRTEWGMTPQTVNAYYSPNMNEIVFPAAILQPPFFYLEADDAVNYGAIGVVIGHEMSHGFDDQGRQYDKEGNLRDWWTAGDSKKFEGQTKVLVDQYNNFKLLDTLHVDGNLTLGENIADLGGVNISLTALDKAMQGKDMNTKIDGFTSPQRFFLSYAQVWRNNIRDKALMRRLKEDVHSPGEARVNGIVYNVPAFYAAFNINPDAKRFIAEDKRAAIW